MAISGFGRNGVSKSGSSSSSMPVSGGTPSASGGGGGLGNLTAFIDQGSEFEGKLSFKDTVRIDGTFSGEITSENTLIVGESGQIHATIQSICVVISGLVEGDINASESIVLHKTAVVKGDLDAPIVVMEEGAQLNGNVRMGKSSSSSSPSAKPTASGSSGSSAGSGASGTPGTGSPQ